MKKPDLAVNLVTTRSGLERFTSQVWAASFLYAL